MGKKSDVVIECGLRVHLKAGNMELLKNRCDWRQSSSHPIHHSSPQHQSPKKKKQTPACCYVAASNMKTPYENHTRGNSSPCWCVSGLVSNYTCEVSLCRYIRTHTNTHTHTHNPRASERRLTRPVSTLIYPRYTLCCRC